MNYADVVSSIGLILDIAGVVLLFLFGLPANVRETGGTILLFGGGKSTEEAKREHRRYKLVSRIGLVCLIFGFSLQLISNFLS